MWDPITVHAEWGPALGGRWKSFQDEWTWLLSAAGIRGLQVALVVALPLR